jgi:hypothetical protein
LKIKRFPELEGQSYPVLEFEVEIRTLARVEGCKLDLTQIFIIVSVSITIATELCNGAWIII